MYGENKAAFHDELIKELLYWIEINLSDRLTLEKASDKTGYSLWHLQRLFKNKTGYALGQYIRQRRLSMAALTLRLSKMPICDVSLHFAYDSQGTFTRSFKQNFSETPGKYRRNSLSPLTCIDPATALNIALQPQFHIVELPDMAFNYRAKLQYHFFEPHPDNRKKCHQKDLTSYFNRSPSEAIWGLSEHCFAVPANESRMRYKVAQESKFLGSYDILIPTSRYLKITYPYELNRLHDYIQHMYSVFSLTLGVRFKAQPHLERYSQKSKSNGLICEYFIPLI